MLYLYVWDDKRGLCERSIIRRFLSFENMLDSRWPLTLLKEISRKISLTSFAIEIGRGPCSLLLFNLRTTKELCRNSPICPVNRLLSRNKNCKDGISYNQDGIVPFNKLSDNHSCTKLEGGPVGCYVKDQPHIDFWALRRCFAPHYHLNYWRRYQVGEGSQV